MAEMDKQLFSAKNLHLESDFRKFGTAAMLQFFTRKLRASLVETDREMVEKCTEQQDPAVCSELALDGMPQDVSALMGLVTFTFDLDTGMRVAWKMRNLHSEFGHDRPLGSRVIRYVRDGRTDRQKQSLLIPSYGRERNKEHCELVYM